MALLKQIVRDAMSKAGFNIRQFWKVPMPGAPSFRVSRLRVKTLLIIFLKTHLLPGKILILAKN